MKELLTVVSLVLSGVVTQPPAPYPPSGWRPNGPSFDLPQRPQSLPPQKQQYLPPVDPRRPLPPNNFDDNVDLSVQGLPIVVEKQPIFEVSPINGQLYNGPSINADIAKLNPSFQLAQYQQQLEKALQFERQRQFEAARANYPSNGLPNQQPPKQFASQPSSSTTTTTPKPEFKSPKPETTTESDLNEGETLENPEGQTEKVSVEVSKQNLQEFRPELLLSPLSQLNAQPQFVTLDQFGQLKAPIYYQPVQGQGFDGPAHLSALPSVLAQRELLSQQQQQLQNQGFAQNPIIVQQDQSLEPINQYQPLIAQYQPIQPQIQGFPQIQPQRVIVQPQVVNQLQPQPNLVPQQPDQYAQQPNQFSLQAGQFPQQPRQFPQQPAQYPLQPAQFPQQPAQLPQQPSQYPLQPGQFPQQPDQFAQQPNQFPQQPGQFPQQPSQFPQQSKDVEEIEPNDQQVVYQNYQPQFYQPTNQYQNAEQPLFLAQPGLINQNQFYQNPIVQYDPNQSQPQVYQDQNALQSGLDIDQGNDLDQADEQEDLEKDDEGSKATAVATAFGARTQPRVFAQYGAPIPKVQANPEYPTTVAPQESESDDGPAIAQATAVATGRRNAKLRSRRVRPIFTLDRSGHLVLAQQQQ
ncbi:unnamed protein product, partial [Brenthis ino]